MKFRVATANIAGGAREEGADLCKYKILGELLSGVDIIGLQEVVQVLLKRELSNLSFLEPIQVQTLSVVHYRSRSLDRILGSVVLNLGKHNKIDEDQFWRQLNVRS